MEICLSKRHSTSVLLLRLQIILPKLDNDIYRENSFKIKVQKSFNKKSSSLESTGTLVSTRILQFDIELPVEAVRKINSHRL